MAEGMRRVSRARGAPVPDDQQRLVDRVDEGVHGLGSHRRAAADRRDDALRERNEQVGAYRDNDGFRGGLGHGYAMYPRAGFDAG